MSQPEYAAVDWGTRTFSFANIRNGKTAIVRILIVARMAVVASLT